MALFFLEVKGEQNKDTRVFLEKRNIGNDRETAVL
jgi:hypothetical protein